MQAIPELYVHTTRDTFSNIYPIPHLDYVPLAQILSWMHSYKKRYLWNENASTLFFKSCSTIYSYLYQSEDELFNVFNIDRINKLYLTYPIKLDTIKSTKAIDAIIKRESFCTHCRQTRSNNIYISGWGLFGIPIVTNQIDCIFCVVIHKDNIQSVINCVLENKEIDNSLLEIWYNSKIRLRGSNYLIKIKTKLNNYIKLLESQGIKSVSMDTIPFFKIIELPKFKNLKEKQEFISDIYKKMLNLQNG